MNILQNISLKGYNTFGIDKKLNILLLQKTVKELGELLDWAKIDSIEVLILGGGSNILLTQDLDFLVIKNEIEGIQVLAENEETILLEVGAGVIWHDLVKYSIDHSWGGIENLSLIPGTVGASPMQNIGAYGVELKEVFESLTALDRADLSIKIFDAKACRFGYRESVFKHELKNKFVICTVTFRLHKNHEFKTSYGAITETLAEKGIKELSIKAISDAVISIRQSKLPDPKVIGNAGSFFKKPYARKTKYEELKTKYPAIPGYENESGVKVPAAWLIEQAGWKGRRIGEVGVHQNQPLVLVNYGNGVGEEIVKLSKAIQDSIFEKFGVELIPEVNFL